MRRSILILALGASCAASACVDILGDFGVGSAGDSGVTSDEGGTEGGQPDASGADAPGTLDGAEHDADAQADADADAGSVPAPVEVYAGGDEEEANNHHACARYSDGRVFCWGLNTWGQLGVDPATTPTGYSSVPVQVAGLTNAKKITAGSGHSCALRTDGTVVCWGHNGSGELGVSTADAGIENFMPQAVSLPGTVADVAGGDVYTCAALTSGALYCWGANDGRFGLGIQGADVNPPTMVPSTTLLTTVTLGPYAAGGIDSAGGAACWGPGGPGTSGGILGRGTASSDTTYYTPDDTNFFGLVTALQSNVVGFCGFASPAATTDGLYCWGGNSSGQLGGGAGSEVLAPTLVPQFTRAAGVVSFGSGYYNTCAVFQSGAVECIGANSQGVVGGGTTPGSSTTPQAVANLSDATAVSVGPSFACAVRRGGGPAGGPSVACWGANQSGQLGNGTTMDSVAAVQVMLPN